ncbi:MAG: serine/threonine protein phosphatase [Hyphomicrobiales bacterium]|nr:MAG: serine/threonine protein phosphatase [Hyphomicrobiales bacterium]
MLLAQLTDMHIKADGRWAYGKVDTVGYLQKAIDHVNRFRPKIDAVILTGDLTDRGGPREFEELRRHLQDLAIPWFPVPGNHDRRDMMREAFADHAQIGACRDFIQYAVDDFPFRLIGIDTTEPGKPYGHLCEARLAWLDACLAAAPDKPTLVFQHHPPFETGIHHMDVQNLLNGDVLMDLLARHPQVRHVACGHVHRPCEVTLRGIGVSIAPNGAHSVSLDLDPEGPSSFTMDPPSLRLFNLDAARGRVVSHVSYVGEFDGPYPFFDMSGALLD